MFQIECKQAMYKRDYWLPVHKPYKRRGNAERRIAWSVAKFKIPRDWYRIVEIKE